MWRLLGRSKGRFEKAVSRKQPSNSRDATEMKDRYQFDDHRVGIDRDDTLAISVQNYPWLSELPHEMEKGTEAH